jgi:hypothetical protein
MWTRVELMHNGDDKYWRFKTRISEKYEGSCNIWFIYYNTRDLVAFCATGFDYENNVFWRDTPLFWPQNICLYQHKVSIGCIGMNNRFSRRGVNFAWIITLLEEPHIQCFVLSPAFRMAQFQGEVNACAHFSHSIISHFVRTNFALQNNRAYTKRFW